LGLKENSYADRWFPTTSQKYSANNKIDISGGTGEFLTDFLRKEFDFYQFYYDT